MDKYFGIISITIGLGASIPYIYGIINGKVKPQRMAWAISVLTKSVTFAAQVAKGAQWSLALNMAGLMSSGIILVLSLKRGVGGFSRQDNVALLLATLSLAVWLISGEALYGLFFAIFADAIGVLLTLFKTYKNPGTESVVTWSMATAASVFGFLAIDAYTLGQAAFPLYSVLGGTALVLVSARKVKSPTN